jgi:hypothetical protein
MMGIRLGMVCAPPYVLRCQPLRLVDAQTRRHPICRLRLFKYYQRQAMQYITHSARVTTPMPYVARCGRVQNIPVGPVLIESMGQRSIDIVWGSEGQNFVSLPIEVVATARDDGRLVVLV